MLFAFVVLLRGATCVNGETEEEAKCMGDFARCKKEVFCYTAPSTDPDKSFVIRSFPAEKALKIDAVLKNFGSVDCLGVRGWVSMVAMEVVFEAPYELVNGSNFNHPCLVGSEQWVQAGGRSERSNAADGIRITLQKVGGSLGGSGGLVGAVMGMIGGSPDEVIRTALSKISNKLIEMLSPWFCELMGQIGGTFSFETLLQSMIDKVLDLAENAKQYAFEWLDNMVNTNLKGYIDTFVTQTLNNVTIIETWINTKMDEAVNQAFEHVEAYVMKLVPQFSVVLGEVAVTQGIDISSLFQQVLQDISDFLIETCQNVTQNWTVFEEDTATKILEISKEKIYSLIRGVTDQAIAFIDEAFAKVEEVANWVQSTMDSIVSTISTYFDKVTTFIADITATVENTFGEVGQVIDAIDKLLGGKGEMTGSIKKVVDALSSVSDILNEKIVGLIDKVIGVVQKAVDIIDNIANFGTNIVGGVSGLIDKVSGSGLSKLFGTAVDGALTNLQLGARKVQSFVDKIKTYTAKIMTFMDYIKKTVLNGIQPVISFIGEAARGINNVISKVMSALDGLVPIITKIKSFIATVQKTVMDFLNTSSEFINEIITKMQDLISTATGQISTWINTALAKIGEFVGASKSFLTNITDKIILFIDKGISKVMDAVDGAITTLIEKAMTLFGFSGDMISDVTNNMNSIVSKGLNLVSDIVSVSKAIKDGLASGDPLTAIIDSALSELADNQLVKDAFSGAVDSIKALLGTDAEVIVRVVEQVVHLGTYADTIFDTAGVVADSVHQSISDIQGTIQTAIDNAVQTLNATGTFNMAQLDVAASTFMSQIQTSLDAVKNAVLTPLSQLSAHQAFTDTATWQFLSGSTSPVTVDLTNQSDLAPASGFSLTTTITQAVESAIETFFSACAQQIQSNFTIAMQNLQAFAAAGEAVVKKQAAEEVMRAVRSVFEPLSDGEIFLMGAVDAAKTYLLDPSDGVVTVFINGVAEKLSYTNRQLQDQFNAYFRDADQALQDCISTGLGSATIADVAADATAYATQIAAQLKVHLQNYNALAMRTINEKFSACGGLGVIPQLAMGRFIASFEETLTNSIQTLNDIAVDTIQAKLLVLANTAGSKIALVEALAERMYEFAQIQMSPLLNFTQMMSEVYLKATDSILSFVGMADDLLQQFQAVTESSLKTISSQLQNSVLGELQAYLSSLQSKTAIPRLESARSPVLKGDFIQILGTTFKGIQSLINKLTLPAVGDIASMLAGSVGKAQEIAAIVEQKLQAMAHYLSPEKTTNFIAVAVSEVFQYAETIEDLTTDRINATVALATSIVQRELHKVANLATKEVNALLAAVGGLEASGKSLLTQATLQLKTFAEEQFDIALTELNTTVKRELDNAVSKGLTAVDAVSNAIQNALSIELRSKASRLSYQFSTPASLGIDFLNKLSGQAATLMDAVQAKASSVETLMKTKIIALASEAQDVAMDVLQKAGNLTSLLPVQLDSLANDISNLLKAKFTGPATQILQQINIEIESTAQKSAAVIDRIAASFTSTITNMLESTIQKTASQVARGLTKAIQAAKQSNIAAKAASVGPVRLSAFDMSQILSNIIADIAQMAYDTVMAGIASITDGSALVQMIQTELESAMLSLVDAATPALSRFTITARQVVGTIHETITGITETIDSALESIGIQRAQMMPSLKGGFFSDASNLLGNAVKFVKMQVSKGMNTIVPTIFKGFSATINAVTRTQVKLTELQSELQGIVNKAFGVITNIQDLTSEYVQGTIEQAVTFVTRGVDQILDEVPQLLHDAINMLGAQSPVASLVVQNAVSVLSQRMSDSVKSLITVLGLELSNSATDILKGSVSIGQVRDSIVSRLRSAVSTGLESFSITEDSIRALVDVVTTNLKMAFTSAGVQLQSMQASVLSALKLQLATISEGASGLVESYFGQITSASAILSKRAVAAVEGVSAFIRETLTSALGELRHGQFASDVAVVFDQHFEKLGAGTLAKATASHLVNVSVSVLQVAVEAVPQLISQRLLAVLDEAAQGQLTLSQVKQRLSMTLGQALQDAQASLQFASSQIRQISAFVSGAATGDFASLVVAAQGFVSTLATNAQSSMAAALQNVSAIGAQIRAAAEANFGHLQSAAHVAAALQTGAEALGAEAESFLNRKISEISLRTSDAVFTFFAGADAMLPIPSNIFSQVGSTIASVVQRAISQATTVYSGKQTVAAFLKAELQAIQDQVQEQASVGEAIEFITASLTGSLIEQLAATAADLPATVQAAVELLQNNTAAIQGAMTGLISQITAKAQGVVTDLKNAVLAQQQNAFGFKQALVGIGSNLLSKIIQLPSSVTNQLGTAVADVLSEKLAFIQSHAVQLLETSLQSSDKFLSQVVAQLVITGGSSLEAAFSAFATDFVQNVSDSIATLATDTPIAELPFAAVAEIRTLLSQGLSELSESFLGEISAQAGTAISATQEKLSVVLETFSSVVGAAEQSISAAIKTAVTGMFSGSATMDKLISNISSKVLPAQVAQSTRQQIDAFAVQLTESIGAQITELQNMAAGIIVSNISSLASALENVKPMAETIISFVSQSVTQIIKHHTTTVQAAAADVIVAVLEEAIETGKTVAQLNTLLAAELKAIVVDHFSGLTLPTGILQSLASAMGSVLSGQPAGLADVASAFLKDVVTTHLGDAIVVVPKIRAAIVQWFGEQAELASVEELKQLMQSKVAEVSTVVGGILQGELFQAGQKARQIIGHIGQIGSLGSFLDGVISAYASDLQELATTQLSQLTAAATANIGIWVQQVVDKVQQTETSFYSALTNVSSELTSLFTAQILTSVANINILETDLTYQEIDMSRIQAVVVSLAKSTLTQVEKLSNISFLQSGSAIEFALQMVSSSAMADLFDLDGVVDRITEIARSKLMSVVQAVNGFVKASLMGNEETVFARIVAELTNTVALTIADELTAHIAETLQNMKANLLGAAEAVASGDVNTMIQEVVGALNQLVQQAFEDVLDISTVMGSIKSKLFNVDTVIDILEEVALSSPELILSMIEPIVGRVTLFIQNIADSAIPKPDGSSSDQGILGRIKQFALEGVASFIDNLDTTIMNVLRTALQCHDNWNNLMDQVLGQLGSSVESAFNVGQLVGSLSEDVVEELLQKAVSMVSRKVEALSLNASVAITDAIASLVSNNNFTKTLTSKIATQLASTLNSTTAALTATLADSISSIIANLASGDGKLSDIPTAILESVSSVVEAAGDQFAVAQASVQAIIDEVYSELKAALQDYINQLNASATQLQSSARQLLVQSANVFTSIVANVTTRISGISSMSGAEITRMAKSIAVAYQTHVDGMMQSLDTMIDTVFTPTGLLASLGNFAAPALNYMKSSFKGMLMMKIEEVTSPIQEVARQSLVELQASASNITQFKNALAQKLATFITGKQQALEFYSTYLPAVSKILYGFISGDTSLKEGVAEIANVSVSLVTARIAASLANSETLKSIVIQAIDGLQTTETTARALSDSLFMKMKALSDSIQNQMNALILKTTVQLKEYASGQFKGLDAISLFVNNITNTLITGMADKITAHLTKISSTLAATSTGIFGNVASALNSVNTGARTVFEYKVALADNIAQALTSIIVIQRFDLAEFSNIVLDNIGDHQATVASQIASAASSVLGNMRDVLKQLAAGRLDLSALVSGTATVLADIGDDVVQTIVVQAEKLFTTKIGALTQSIGSMLGTQLAQIGAASPVAAIVVDQLTSELGDTVQQTLMQIISSVSDAVSTSVQAAQSSGSSIESFISGAVQSVKEQITNELQQLSLDMGFVRNATAAILTELSSSITEEKTQIIQKIRQVIDGVKSAGSMLQEQLQAIVSQAVTAVMGAQTEALSTAQITALSAHIRNTISASVFKITAGLDSQIRAKLSEITELQDSVIGGAVTNSLAQGVASMISEQIDALLMASRNVVEKAVESATSTVAGYTDAIREQLMVALSFDLIALPTNVVDFAIDQLVGVLSNEADTFLTAAANMLADAFSQGSNALAEAYSSTQEIATRVLAAVEYLTANVSQTGSDVVSSVLDSARSVYFALESQLTQDIGRLIEQLGTHVSAQLSGLAAVSLGSADALFNLADQAIDSLTSGLDSVLDAMRLYLDEQLLQILQGIDASQDSVAEAQQRIAAEIASAFNSELVSQLSSVSITAEDLKAQFSEFATSMTADGQSFVENVVNSAETVVLTLTSKVAAITDSLSGTMRATVEGVVKQAASLISSDKIQLIADMVSEQINSALSALQDSAIGFLGDVSDGTSSVIIDAVITQLQGVVSDIVSSIGTEVQSAVDAAVQSLGGETDPIRLVTEIGARLLAGLKQSLKGIMDVSGFLGHLKDALFENIGSIIRELVSQIATNTDFIQGTISQVGQDLAQLTGSLYGGLYRSSALVATGTRQFSTEFKNIVSAVFDGMGDSLNFGSVQNVLTSFINTTMDDIENIIDAVAGNAGSILQGFETKFQETLQSLAAMGTRMNTSDFSQIAAAFTDVIQNGFDLASTAQPMALRAGVTDETLSEAAQKIQDAMESSVRKDLSSTAQSIGAFGSGVLQGVTKASLAIQTNMEAVFDALVQAAQGMSASNLSAFIAHRLHGLVSEAGTLVTAAFQEAGDAASTTAGAINEIAAMYMGFVSDATKNATTALASWSGAQVNDAIKIVQSALAPILDPSLFLQRHGTQIIAPVIAAAETVLNSVYSGSSFMLNTLTSVKNTAYKYVNEVVGGISGTLSHITSVASTLQQSIPSIVYQIAEQIQKQGDFDSFNGPNYLVDRLSDKIMSMFMAPYMQNNAAPNDANAMTFVEAQANKILDTVKNHVKAAVLDTVNSGETDAPALTALSERVATYFRDVLSAQSKPQTLVDQVFSQLESKVPKMFTQKNTVINFVITTFGPTIESFGSGISEFLTSDVFGAIEDFTDIDVGSILETIGSQILTKLGESFDLETTINTLLDQLIRVLPETLIGGFADISSLTDLISSTIGDSATNIVKEILAELKGIATTAIENIKAFISEKVQQLIATAHDAIMTWINDKIDKVYQKVRDFIENAWDKYVQPLVDKLKKWLDKMLGKLEIWLNSNLNFLAGTTVKCPPISSAGEKAQEGGCTAEDTPEDGGAVGDEGTCTPDGSDPSVADTIIFNAGTLTRNSEILGAVQLAVELASDEEVVFMEQGYGPKEFCSAGFIYYIFSNLSLATLPTEVDQIILNGESVEFSARKPGDLLFFDLTGQGQPNHVGIYLGGNMMAHAMNEAAGVTYQTKLTEIFWLKQGVYVEARRLIPEPIDDAPGGGDDVIIEDPGADVDPGSGEVAQG